MKYEALKDSWDHNRVPKYCVQGHLYEFDTDPGKLFRAKGDAPPADLKEETPPTKAALIARAEALGLNVDKRKSAKTIQKMITEADNGNE